MANKNATNKQPLRVELSSHLAEKLTDKFLAVNKAREAAQEWFDYVAAEYGLQGQASEWHLIGSELVHKSALNGDGPQGPDAE